MRWLLLAFFLSLSTLAQAATQEETAIFAGGCFGQSKAHSIMFPE